MLENDWAIFKLQFKIAMKERIVFFYTLVIPFIMLFINRTEDFQDNEALYVYWSYIVVITLLNGFLMQVIHLRESGSLKTLTYMTGSKTSIILAVFLVQLLMIQSEIILFNLVVTLLVTHVSGLTILYGFLTSFLAATLCTAMLSGLMILKIKRTNFNLMINLFLLIGIILLGIRPSGVLNYWLTVFNPFQLIYGLYFLPMASGTFKILVASCTIIYLFIGIMILHKLSVKSRLKGA